MKNDHLNRSRSFSLALIFTCLLTASYIILMPTGANASSIPTFQVDQGQQFTFEIKLSKVYPYEIRYTCKSIDGSATAGTHFKGVSSKAVNFPSGRDFTYLLVPTYRHDPSQGSGFLDFKVVCENPQKWEHGTWSQLPIDPNDNNQARRVTHKILKGEIFYGWPVVNNDNDTPPPDKPGRPNNPDPDVGPDMNTH